MLRQMGETTRRSGQDMRAEHFHKFPSRGKELTSKVDWITPNSLMHLLKVSTLLFPDGELDACSASSLARARLSWAALNSLSRFSTFLFRVSTPSVGSSSLLSAWHQRGGRVNKLCVGLVLVGLCCSGASFSRVCIVPNSEILN